jgi:[acyl-carrier-protein] S-malonyltransferase
LPATVWANIRRWWRLARSVFADAVRLVRRRGRYMQEAVPVGVGGMAAILGLDIAAVESICAEAAAGDVVRPANLNSPTQVVIAGHVGAVERAVALAKGAGAKRAITLPVSAPFHCELLEPAAVRLGADLDALRFENLQFPLVTNVDARPITAGGDARDALKRQVARPVRWSESVRRMLDDGAGAFVEVGPGKVLTGLVRSIDKSVPDVQRGRREIAGKCLWRTPIIPDLLRRRELHKEGNQWLPQRKKRLNKSSWNSWEWTRAK